MAEPGKEKRPIYRRRMTPMREQYTAPTDAVNETLRVSGMAPELVARRQLAVQAQRQALELKAKQLKARRDQYRARRLAQDKANGIMFSMPMSDEQVDLAIAQEAYMANLPQLRQGYSESERQARRRAGLLYTQEDMEQAKRLAEAHNASFFGSMVAPPISPEMAARNPGYVNQVIRGDAMVLPNALMSGLTFGAPSLTSAVTRGAVQGWQTAGNVATRVGNAAVQGVKAAAPVVTNPRWAAVTAGVTAPAVADAAVTAGDGGGSSGSALPYMIGAAALGTAGFGGYKGYKVLKGANWNIKALAPTAEGSAIRAAARAPQTTTTALVPYVGTYQRPGFFESWWETPKASAKAGGFPVPTKGQIWGARGRNYLRATGYGMAAGTLLDLGMSGATGEPFQWKAGSLPIAVPKAVGKGAYNVLKDWYYPNGTLTQNTAPVDSVATQSSQVANPTDTIVPVPRHDNSPITTSTQAELDSINNAWFNGLSIQ